MEERRVVAVLSIDPRNSLKRIAEKFANDRRLAAVAVMRQGKVVLAVLPWADYLALKEVAEAHAEGRIPPV